MIALNEGLNVHVKDKNKDKYKDEGQFVGCRLTRVDCVSHRQERERER
jgi:hypothetical protein